MTIIVKERAQMINRSKCNVHEKNAGALFQMRPSMTEVSVSVSHLEDNHPGRMADH
jgi:hypothetical protein